jgi:DNA polymerase bacteriophage-type
MRIFIDFETRSACDLRRTNAWVYSKHDTTDVLCMAWAVDANEVNLWLPGDIIPLEFSNPDAVFVAHNVKFEWSIWQNVLVPKYGFSPLRHTHIEDTMAMAYALALPGSLDNAAKAVGIDHEKDSEGHGVMLRVSKPRKIENDGTIIWWNDEARMQRLYEYCKQDVAVERELYIKLLKLTPVEMKTFQLDHVINHRGIRIDRAACEAFVKATETAAEDANTALSKATKGRVTSGNQVMEMRAFLNEIGVPIPDLAAATVADHLEDDALPDLARQVLETRQIVSKSSVKKIQTMLRCADEKDRVRHTTAYHGAATGRWAGRDIQPQNFPRPSLKQAEIEDTIARVLVGDIAGCVEAYGGITAVTSSCVRGLIVSTPGYDLISADFSNIEGRVLAWLAGEKWKLKAFEAFDAGKGPDLYLVTAAGIYDVPVSSLNKESPERQIGKVSELACGFGGGVGAFHSMAKNYGVVVTDERADEIKVAWRKKHPKTVSFWYALERAAVNALRKPGSVTAAGPIRFRKSGAFLFCQLPSRRCLSYPYAELFKKKVPWSDRPKQTVRYKTVLQPSRKWGWTDTYGGKLAENVTQAVARDLLRDAMFRVEAAGYPVVLHVHDELNAEIPEGFGSQDEFNSLMREVPQWATGCPVDVAGWRGKRYRK